MAGSHVSLSKHSEMPIRARSSGGDDVVLSFGDVVDRVLVKRLASEIANEPKPIRRRLTCIALLAPALALMLGLNAHGANKVVSVGRINDGVQASNLSESITQFSRCRDGRPSDYMMSTDAQLVGRRLGLGDQDRIQQLRMVPIEVIVECIRVDQLKCV
jgi:hypothetical protein